MRKFLLNLAPGEPLALVQELPYFDDSIKLDPLLSSELDLCVHNLIIGCLLYEVRVELCWFFKDKFVSADTDQSPQIHLDLEQTVTEYYSFPSSKVLNGQEKKDEVLTL
jgi:hypothetical protein